MVKYIRILVILVCFISLNAFAQKATSIALDYDTSGYRENNNSTATLKTVDILAPAIQANMNINEAGALTYSIPIECLKGINNFQPNISLGYNSQAGNGLVGWGWNIIGISTITQGGKATKQME
ncbi:SpvB/TcaC N-terminal domain-containing protein [Chryseobacterium wanjuense]